MIVVWRVVDSCNLSCPFCAFDKRLEFPRSSADPKDILAFAQVLALHQARTGDRVLLSWLGGEPLLWRPLEQLTRAARALGLDVSATTNGTALGSRKLRRHICENYRELTVSIDGFAGFHDPMRGWPGGFEKLRAWVPLLANEARALDAALKLRVNVVLMHQNVAEFPQLCAELAAWGVNEITFNQLGGRDRPEFYPSHRLTLSDVDRLEAKLPGIRARLSDNGVMLVGGSGYLSRIRASALDQTNPVEDCAPGQSFLFIDERGRMTPCSFTTADYGVDVRTIRTQADIADCRPGSAPCNAPTARRNATTASAPRSATSSSGRPSRCALRFAVRHRESLPFKTESGGILKVWLDIVTAPSPDRCAVGDGCNSNSIGRIGSQAGVRHRPLGSCGAGPAPSFPFALTTVRERSAKRRYVLHLHLAVPRAV